MAPSTSFLAHWYFHVPNLVMAALVWLLVGRLLLAPILSRYGESIAGRVLRGLTDPVLRVVGAVTPRVVPAALVVVFAIVWLTAARLVLFAAVTATGVRLALG